MYQTLIPSNYSEWKYCITVECGIPLTSGYIEQRLVELKNMKSTYTQRFINIYGEQYLENVIAWFKQAKKELNDT